MNSLGTDIPTCLAKTKASHFQFEFNVKYLLPARVKFLASFSPLFCHKSSSTSSIIRAPRKENVPKDEITLRFTDRTLLGFIFVEKQNNSFVDADR